MIQVDAFCPWDIVNERGVQHGGDLSGTLKGNAKPFAYQGAKGVAILCRDGKAIEVVPLAMIDVPTVECNKEAF